MAHQLGVAFGTVLSAILGFFVADQVWLHQPSVRTSSA
jgi:hypothetical protein